MDLEDLLDVELTFVDRYYVGISKDKVNKECYYLVFEAKTLEKCKKRAKEIFDSYDYDVVIWDRERWGTKTGEEIFRFKKE